MVSKTEHAYIVSDDQILGGEPIIAGTRTPVRAIVELWRLGSAPEEIPQRLPHLTLAQVFDALSYAQRSSGRDQCSYRAQPHTVGNDRSACARPVSGLFADELQNQVRYI
jgi:uncharacterized protein (DUF433 family)